MYSIKYFEIRDVDNENLLNMKIGDEFKVDSLVKYPDESTYTKIKYLGLSENENFKKYLITFNKPVNVSGYYKSEYIEYYIADVDIGLYLHKDNAHILIKGNTKLVNYALEDLKNHKIISLKNVKINLSGLKDDPDVFVKGGWFKNTNIVKVSSATIFGSSVNESDLWEELDQVGTLTRVVFEICADPRPFSLTINEDANFILYESWDEMKSLKRLSNLIDTVVKDFFIRE